MTFDPGPLTAAAASLSGVSATEKAALEVEKLRLELQELRYKIAEKADTSHLLDRQIAAIEREDEYVVLRSYIDQLSLDRLELTTRKWLDQHLPTRPRPLTVVLTSPGGDIFSGLAHYDLIKNGIGRGLTINTEIQGYAASMAGIISQAGVTRRITENSWLMIHEASYVRQQLTQLAEMRDQLKLLDTLHNRCLGLLANRSHLTVEDIAEKTYKYDWWMPAEEALELGFVDEIRSS